MKLAKYFIYFPLLLVLLLCVLVTLAAGWLSYTESGLRLLADKVSVYEPRLNFDDPRGSLLGQAQFSAIRWQQDKVEVLLTDVKLDIAPVCFFALSVCAKNLSIGQLLVGTQSDDSKMDTPVELPTVALPFEIFLTQASIQQLAISHDAQTQFTASQLTFKNVNWRQEKITFSQWRAKLYNEKLKLAGSITLKDNYPIKVNASLIPSQLGVVTRHIKPSATADSSVGRATLAIVGDLKSLHATFNLKGALALTGEAEIKPLVHAAPFELSANFERALIVNAQDNELVVKTGQLKLHGDINQLNFSTSAIVRLPLIADDSALAVTGSSDYQSIYISDSSLSSSQGTVTAKGIFGLNDTQPTELKLTVTDFNAEFIAPAYPSLLDLTALLTIENLYSKPSLTIALSQLEGELLKEPFQTSGSLNWRSDFQLMANQFAFKQWKLISEPVRLQFNGGFPNQALSWSATVQQLNKVFPAVKGRATVAGQLSGTINKPNVSAKLQFDDLIASDITAKKVIADIDIKQLAWQSSRVSLHANEVSLESADDAVDIQLNLSAQQQGSSRLIARHFVIGKLLDSRFDLLVKQQDGWSSSINCQPLITIASLDVELSCPKLEVLIAEGMAGFYNPDVANAAIADLSVSNQDSKHPNENRWLNDQTLNIQWQHDNRHLSIEPFCLTHQNAAICLQNTDNGQSSAEPGVQLSGKNLPLDWLRTLTPGNFNLSGQWQFNASLQEKPSTRDNQDGAQWQLSGTIGSQSALLSKQLENGNTIKVPLDNIDLNFSGDNNSFDSTFVLQSESLGNLNGQLKYHQQTLTGSVIAEELDAQIFQGFIQDAKHLNGHFSSAIDFSLADQSLNVYGDIEFSNIDFTARTLPVEITQANIKIQFDKQSMLSTGAMKFGDGDAIIEANGNWQEGALQAELKFTGKDIVIHPLPDSFITLAPDLLLTVQPDQLKLSGDVLVSEAHIELKALPKNAIVESDDVIIEESDTGIASTQFMANIKARLSDDVSFKGFGLETHLGGHLQIQSQPGQLITGNGVINLIDGRYRAYGQNLVIEEGRMIFSGPLANPELFVTAIRPYTEGDVRVGVEVTGTAKDAQLTLFSSPPKTENEILSYLLTGKAPQNTSVDESRLAQQMAISLGMAQTNRAARNIAESVGIEDFRMGTELGRNGDEAQMSGYIAPNLFLLYGVSMFDRSSSITARYELSSRVYVEVYSGAASAINIFWSVIK